MINIKFSKLDVKFVAGANKVEQLPRSYGLKEVVFLGKSNVGKSSLINMLFNKKSLAKVSHTPGRTQQINFFSADNKFLIVDLPGYGFASVSQKTRDNWEKLILFYLLEYPSNKLIYILIDSRRGIKERDIKLMHLLNSYNISFQIIYTKIDKVKDLNIITEQDRVLLKNLAFVGDVINTSSRSKQGAKEIQADISRYLRN